MCEGAEDVGEEVVTDRNWTIQPGFYPGFIEIAGASFKVSIVLSALDLSFDDATKRTADAYLMAAAPELYEALFQMASIFGGDRALFDKARLALAKARVK